MTMKQKSAIQSYFFSAVLEDSDLKTVEPSATFTAATQRILENLNIANSFDQAGAKLAANFSDKVEAVRAYREERRQLREQMALEREQMEKEAEAEWAALQAEAEPPAPDFL